MSQDTRKRGRRVIAFVALLALLILLTVWLRGRHLSQSQANDLPSPAVLHETGPLGPPDPDISLIVTESGDDGHGTVTRCRVVRYDFKSGQVQPPETVWEGAWKQFGDIGMQPIIDNRYLVAGSGSVIDLKEKTLLHEGTGRLIEARGDRVVSGSFNDKSGRPERLVAFNFRTRAVEKLTDREVEEFTLRGEGILPGVPSPDGMKAVSVSDDKSLALYRVGQQSKKLGHLESDPYSSSSAVWLDNERFLTQDGNGNLIEMDLDGGRVPVVQIPVQEKNYRWSWFNRDADGRIIYSCGHEHFFIDTEAKTWELCTWVSLGHGFKEFCRGDCEGRWVYQYKGAEIARSPFWTLLEPREVTTEGYIAVWIAGQLQVWSAGTGKWTKLGTHSHQIAGWIK